VSYILIPFTCYDYFCS